MNFTNLPLINSVLGNATIKSASLDTSFMFKLSGVVRATHASANGTMQLQASNVTGAPTESDWVNLGSPATISGAGNTIIAQQDLSYRWIRAVYTDSSGGSATALITLSVFGFTF